LGIKEHVELESLTEAKSLKQIFNIFKRDIKAYNSGKELSQDATMAFMYYAMKNGEIKTDDPDEFDQWLDNNIPESVQKEGAEIYTVKKGSFTRKVDGKTADKMKRQGWKLVAKESTVLEANITKSKYYKDRDRKGHEGRLVAVGVKWTDIEKAIIATKFVGKAHMSSFDGSSSNPKEVEVMGDLKALNKIALKLKYSGKVSVDKNSFKESVDLLEATGREITLDWDMDDPGEYAADWQDQGVYLDDWNKRKMEIEVSGMEKDLLKWLVDDYGMDKREAQNVIRKGKKVKL
jgi:hypothetical protein